MVDLNERWEQLARQDAEFYIWTDVAKGDDFFASGERDAARILDLASRYVTGNRRVLEIGCGVGRLLLPLSRTFEHAIGVDIAPTMLAKLTENCRRAGATNVVGMLANDAWESAGSVDFAYCHIVFQHIEEWAQIERYFARVAACLSPDGAFYAQFDTRPPSMLYHVKNTVPDALLKPNHRRGVRRIRRTPRQVLSLAQSHGLTSVHQEGAGTSNTIFIFKHAGNRS